jgi:exopolysaccharide biosynthesis polyprenyl glycosylphosphotransferase
MRLIKIFKLHIFYKLFRLFMLGADAAVLYISAYIALQIRLRMGDAFLTSTNISDITEVLPFICVIGLFLLYIHDLYAAPERSVFDIIYSIILTVFMLGIITMALSFFFRTFAFPRTVIFISAVFQFLLLSIWRVFALYIGRFFYGRQILLIIGRGTEIETLANKIRKSPGRLYEIKYLFDADKEEYKTLRRLIQQVEHVFICPGITSSERQKIFSYCVAADKGFFIIPDLFEISVKNAQMQAFDDTPVFKVSHLKLSWEQQLLKRLFDIAFSLLVILLSAPVMLISALLIKLTSPGPVIFKQERLTANNRLFFVYKFRTMYDNAEDLSGPVLAAQNDKRITPVGAFLRSKRIDEFPQFFNVLIGSMSVVGPRPERPFFIEQFKRELPDYEYRAAVKAGITGYAQVMGKYTTSFSDKLRFDLWYIKNYSIWLDITLVLKTVKVIFTKAAAGGRE